MNARKEWYENLTTSVVVDTKNLASSYYSVQIREQRWHTVTKFLYDEKAHRAITTNILNPWVLEKIGFMR